MEDKSLQLLTKQELEIHRRFTNGTRDRILCNEIRFYTHAIPDTYDRIKLPRVGFYYVSAPSLLKNQIFSFLQVGCLTSGATEA